MTSDQFEFECVKLFNCLILIFEVVNDSRRNEFKPSKQNIYFSGVQFSNHNATAVERQQAGVHR